MVRDFIKGKPGKRGYKRFSDEAMEECKQLVPEHGQRGAIAIMKEKHQKISRGALQDALKGSHDKPAGGQLTFSNEEEDRLLENIVTAASWGYLLSSLDVRFIAKMYLDGVGRQVTKFKDNLPGYEWAKSFIQRHKKVISTRICNNLSVSRSKLSRAEVTEFITNLTATIGDIPPENVFNADETGLVDTPGTQKLIFRRGTKYPDRIAYSLKTAYSVMFCCSASGTVLPPYVCYRNEAGCNPGWTRGGPLGDPLCTGRCCSRGTGFGATKSGWFDGVAFQQWFEHCFLPHAKGITGPKVLILDNLSSHFNDGVITQCNDNDIRFVCLPPNATHLLQPLDVAFFHPLKDVWRSMIKEYRLQNNNQSISKASFPSLLKMTLTTLATHKDGIGNNAISGFRATGLYPVSEDAAVKHLPPDLPSDATVIEGIFVTYLRELRTPNANMAAKRQRKSKRNRAPPGTSIMAADESADEDEREASRSTTNKKQKKSKDVPCSSLDVQEDSDGEQESESEAMEGAMEDEGEPIDLNLNVITRVMQPIDLTYGDNGDLVAGVYQPGKSRKTRTWYIGRVIRFEKDATIKVKFLHPTVEGRKKEWFWPTRPDFFPIPFDNIMAKVTSGIFLSKKTNVDFEISCEVLDDIEKCFLAFLKSN